MLRIRLLRTGKKNQPCFKIVVTDKKNPPRGGRFKEEVGFYNPLTKEKVLREERVKYWLGVGAKPSDTVYNLLVSQGIIKAKKIALHKKPKKKKEATVEEKPEAAEAKAKPDGKEEKQEEVKEVKPAESPDTGGSGIQAGKEKAPQEEKVKKTPEKKPESEEKPESAEPKAKKPAEEKPKEKSEQKTKPAPEAKK